jgi:hypothetical protein
MYNKSSAIVFERPKRAVLQEIIETNPRFVDKDTDNWRLTKGSPCVNTGANKAWMTLDLDGHSRIDRFSGIVDMGCFEYLSHGMIISVP